MSTLASLLVVGTLAQAVPDPARAEQAAAAVQIQSVWDFIIKGGSMMIPIGLASLVALAVVIERALSLRRKRIIPADFLPGLETALKAQNGGRQEALTYCRAHASPLANIFAAGIRRLHEPVERLEKHIAEAGQREVLKLRKYLRLLSLIASIAPLLGLLGTIFGMIRAFQTVASSAEALGKTELLAKGIYQAMITTAAGLIVAIPVLIGYHWISAKIGRLVMEIDQMTVEFIEDNTAGRRLTEPARHAAEQPQSQPAAAAVEPEGVAAAAVAAT
ncbi:MAG: MotA/TolQ/ExbB proton channel family protein [Planctomycetes bacterium]|nr:MotA/TolQ/ExbB proton channel family protein [Planctomycetota bacterium]